MTKRDYTPDIRKRIKLTPPQEYLDVWKRDYEAMQLSMIYGDSPSFDKLLERMAKVIEMRNGKLVNLSKIGK